MTTLRLTYQELAERVGRSSEGARMLARRRHWRIERGNDGKARVVVTEAELVVRPTGRPPGQVTDAYLADHVLFVELEAVRADRDRLVQELLQARERAAKAEGQTVELHNAINDLAHRLDQATADLAATRRPWLERLLAAIRGDRPR